MSKITRKSLLSAASAFTIAAFSAPIAYAQDAETTQTESTSDETKTLDTIVVTGIRASLAKSVLDKRNADKVVDTINAEDIGKSTDQNIAEALNRISGISINTVDGEGSSISVRGANADQTVITLNGATLGSTGVSQGVDLSAYSADILEKVEVIKTPSADDEEGSLGGLVNLQTRKPLDIEKNVRAFNLEGRYNDLSDQTNYKFSGTASHKFFDDKVGVLVTVYDETNTVRRDEFLAQNYNRFSANIYSDVDGNVFANQAAIDAETLASTTNGRANEFAGAQSVAAFNGSTSAYGDIVDGIAPSTTRYNLHENQRDRSGFDASVQWAPTNKTDVTFNLTYNKQEFDNRTDGVFIGTQRRASHIDGLGIPGYLPGRFNNRTTVYDTNLAILGGTIAGQTEADRQANLNDPNNDPTSNDGLRWTDPQQDWRILDPNTRDWVKYVARTAIGSTEARVNRFERENYVVGTEINHEFTDNFRVKVGASTSKSEETPEVNLLLQANGNQTIGQWNLHHVPADLIEPAGYDCTGGNCRLIGGTTAPYLGAVVDVVPAGRADLWDNIGYTGFNPDDLASHTLSFLSSTINRVEDEQSVAFADFDWDVDFGGITSLEFGGKYTKREKFVDLQTGRPLPSGEVIQAISPLTGQTIFLDPSNINLINAAIFADGQLNPEGFLDGLGYETDAITNGWARFDPEAGFAAVVENAGEFEFNNLNTRGAEFENFAAYLKTNFSYMDDRIRGDIGVRYVKTEVQTTGFGGANFTFDSLGQGRIIDPIIISQMRNSDQSNACPVLSETPDPVSLGLGPASEFWTGAAGDNDPTTGGNYDLTGFQQRNAAARVNGLCYDPLLEQGALPENFFERNLVRYADLSTERDLNGERVNLNLASFAASDTHEYDVFLPSMNVSFAATDDWIFRFAASRTMARPPIDDLRAGFTFNEGSAAFQGTAFRGSNINMFGAGLDPLTSTNLDFSAEWYFAKDSLLSINLFNKKIKDQLELADSRWYVGDLRTIAADPDNASFDGSTVTSSTGSAVDLLLTPESDLSAIPDITQCMPRRLQGEAALANGAEILYGDDPRLLCNVYNVTQRINAAESDVTGVEFQYVQNYTFLPGIFSGLGVQANYTYQEGEVGKTGFPVPGTPEQSYNVTAYWQEGGHQVRLAYSGASDVLEAASFQQGARWREGRDTLDFSAAYQMSDNLSLTFHASNLTDEPVRTYWTSRQLLLRDASGEFAAFDEGSAYDNAPKHRTLQEYNTGRIFRLGLRAEF